MKGGSVWKYREDETHGKRFDWLSAANEDGED